MSLHPDPNHYVRRVVLPSGKTIEVVYFEDHAALSAPAPQRDQRDLHLCAACGRDLVYPVQWDEAGPAHWEVSLRCPNCEWTAIGIYEQEDVERFDEELDRGTEALVRDLRRLAQANLEGDIERFVDALESDLIVPEDF